jgi:hypothetical protein
MPPEHKVAGSSPVWRASLNPTRTGVWAKSRDTVRTYVPPRSGLIPPAFLKYFTARVKKTPRNPDAPGREEIYLRALRTFPEIEIIEGKFYSTKAHLPLESSPETYVTVRKYEEKGSDVNLAVHLLHDGWKDLYEAGFVISNDTDLVEAIRLVTQDLEKPVGVISPDRKRMARPGRIRPCSFPRPNISRPGHSPRNLSDFA